MKIKAAHETEAFINGNGYYAIKQELPWPEDPVVVELTPDQMRLIIADMEEYLEHAEDWFDLVDSGEVSSYGQNKNG